MGRIRKALSITSVIATGGALGAPVKWESSAEKASKEQARLLKEQNELLTTLARNNQRPAGPPAPGPRAVLVCCVEWISHLASPIHRCRHHVRRLSLSRTPNCSRTVIPKPANPANTQQPNTQARQSRRQGDAGMQLILTTLVLRLMERCQPELSGMRPEALTANVEPRYVGQTEWRCPVLRRPARAVRNR
jgi:hypothetical protein